MLNFAFLGLLASEGATRPQGVFPAHKEDQRFISMDGADMLLQSC